MIIAGNVTKQFGKLKALDDLSITFNKGEVIGLIGPNGSGKTTLIKTILGMVVPDSGFITVKGQNILHHWLYREQIGYMPQIGRYPDNMTIGQVINLMKHIRGNGVATDEFLLEKYQINEMLHKRMRTLSGGTRQKVSACLAFMFKPEMMILDEPTAGLDPVAAQILKEKIIIEKNNGKLIIITSHILSELEEMISHVVYMQEGKLVLHQSFEALQTFTGEQKLSKAITSFINIKAL